MLIVNPELLTVSCIYLCAGYSILPGKRDTVINKRPIRENNRAGLLADL